MSNPIFVRACPRCSVLWQTHDQTGKTPCEDCAKKPKAIAPVIRPSDASPPSAASLATPAPVKA